MTVKELYDYFLGKADWVNREHTPDIIEFGNPDAEVSKIGVGWSACTMNLRAAAGDGCDLFITHEPSFCDVWSPEAAKRETEWGRRRLAILEENSLALIALHDTWDVWPEAGIHDAWVALLGLDKLLERKSPLPRLRVSLYETPETSLRLFAEHVAARVGEFGQHGVIVHGDLTRRVNKVAVGTGCCLPEAEMLSCGADVLVHALDGSPQSVIRLPLLDLGASIIEVEHAVAEMPGMRQLAAYINGTFRDLSAVFYRNEPESLIVKPPETD